MNSRGEGFSLVEAMVALVILSVGLLALARFQGSVTQASAQAKARTEALRLAQGKIETFRGFASLSALVGLANAPSGANTETVTGTNAIFTRTWRWETTALPAYRSLGVTVRWQDQRGIMHTVALKTRLSSVEPSEAGNVLWLLGKAGS